MSAVNPVIDALDRIETITVCLEAVSDLVTPETDMHIVNRDKHAMLLSFLIAEHRAALDKLGKAMKPARVVNITRHDHR